MSAIAAGAVRRSRRSIRSARRGGSAGGYSLLRNTRPGAGSIRSVNSARSAGSSMSGLINLQDTTPMFRPYHIPRAGSNRYQAPSSISGIGRFNTARPAQRDRPNLNLRPGGHTIGQPQQNHPAVIGTNRGSTRQVPGRVPQVTAVRRRTANLRRIRQTPNNGPNIIGPNPGPVRNAAGYAQVVPRANRVPANNVIRTGVPGPAAGVIPPAPGSAISGASTLPPPPGVARSILPPGAGGSTLPPPPPRTASSLGPPQNPNPYSDSQIDRIYESIRNPNRNIQNRPLPSIPTQGGRFNRIKNGAITGVKKIGSAGKAVGKGVLKALPDAAAATAMALGSLLRVNQTQNVTTNVNSPAYGNGSGGESSNYYV